MSQRSPRNRPQVYLEREPELVFSRDTWKLSGGWGLGQWNGDEV